MKRIDRDGRTAQCGHDCGHRLPARDVEPAGSAAGRAARGQESVALIGQRDCRAPRRAGHHVPAAPARRRPLNVCVVDALTVKIREQPRGERARPAGVPAWAGRGDRIGPARCVQADATAVHAQFDGSSPCWPTATPTPRNTSTTHAPTCSRAASPAPRHRAPAHAGCGRAPHGPGLPVDRHNLADRRPGFPAGALTARWTLRRGVSPAIGAHGRGPGRIVRALCVQSLAVRSPAAG